VRFYAVKSFNPIPPFSRGDKMYEEFMGTQPVSERQKFDVDALQAYMRAHVEGFSGELSVEQFKGGQSNPTFKLSAGDRRYVLRTKPGPAARLLASAHAIDREFRVMDALNKAGFPAARQYALCNDEAIIGRAFYVMEFVDGRVLWDQSLPGMSNSDRAAHYDEMNRVISQLHTIDYAAIGLADYGKPGNYFMRQIDRWSKQYKASETEKIEAMDNLIEWLPKNIPPGDATSIVHGDYRLDNMIFHPTEPRVLAVLDWELSTLGHPLADLAYCCLAWRTRPEEEGLLGVDVPGLPSEAEFVTAYSAAAGRPMPADLDVFVVFSLFRWAAIVAGIYRRALDGNASDANAVNVAGGKFRRLARRGWEIAQGC
jgi:aminoglycoside phosphotransferase (APT) family kinase protein